MIVNREPLAHASVLHVEGALRAPLGAELQRCVQSLLARGERRILLNLAGVSGLDAAGLGELVRAYNLAAAANGALRIIQVPDRLRELIARVGLLDLLRGSGVEAPEREDRTAGRRVCGIRTR